MNIKYISLFLDTLVPIARSKDAWKYLGLSNDVSTGFLLLTMAATPSYRKIKCRPIQLPIKYCLLYNLPIKKHNNKTKSRFHAVEILDEFIALLFSGTNKTYKDFFTK